MSDNLKKALFEKMKAENLFWSYAKDVAMEDVAPGIFIETVLKYGDVDDIRQLKNMFADGEIHEAWAQRVMFDSRFDRLNFYLAKVVFDVDLTLIKQKKAAYDRSNKIRALASQH